MSPKAMKTISVYSGGMFHWICPECGREIPPNQRECPACDPKAVSEEAAQGPEVPVVAAADVPFEPAAQVLPDAAGLRQMAIALGILDAEPEAAPAPAIAPEPAPVLGLVMESDAPQAAVALLAPPAEKVALAKPELPPEPAPAPQPSAPGPLLKLFPLRSYFPGAGRAVQPIALKPRIRRPDSGPRITLPGPMLPPALVSLEDAGVVTVLRTPPRLSGAGAGVGVPGWLVSVLVALVLFLLAVIAIKAVLPRSAADPKVLAAEPRPPIEDNPVALASYPLSKYIEVTGFRIVVDLNKKSEIHYLAVNHSPTRLSDLNVFVTLRSAGARPGQPPICRFSFKAPDLGPFESKEMVSSIEKLSRPVAVPEWQDLKADVQVAP
jgi:hypothetical protein